VFAGLFNFSLVLYPQFNDSEIMECRQTTALRCNTQLPYFIKSVELWHYHSCWNSCNEIWITGRIFVAICIHLTLLEATL